MRILLNIAPLRPPLTGIGRYTWELLQGMRQHPDIDEVVTFADGVPAEPEHIIGSMTDKPVTARARPVIKRWAQRIPSSHALYAHWCDLRFRRWMDDYRDAVYHEPNYLLRPFPGACVTAVHDLSYLHYPDFHPPQRIRLMQAQLPRTLQRADHILTLSDFIRQELIDLLGIDPRRITTTPLAAAGSFQPYERQHTQSVLSQYNLHHDGYLLSVATLEPRKNLLALTDSYCALPAELRRQYPLVLVGSLGWQLELFQARLKQQLSRGEIRHLGYIPENELPLIYAGARGFACTSVYEGFGLPVLEAMACGVPVLSSDRSSLPEVVGDAGLLIDPDQHDQLVTGLEQLLTDETFRQRSRERGLARARQFSWTRFINKVVSVYRQIV